MGYSNGSLSPVTFPASLPEGLPRVFDDTSFAFSLGLRCRTVWWLIHSSKPDVLDSKYGAYRVFSIPKKNGDKRLIHAPKPTMKRVQRVLLRTYLDPLPNADCVGAYVQGRDLVYSVNKHVGKDVVLKFDLRNFFNATRRVWVREWLAELGFPADVVVVMSGLMCVPITYGNKTYWGLPQGAPTSGSVANHVAASRLDAPMLERLQRHDVDDISYTRYADDLTISYNRFLPEPAFQRLIEDIKDVIRDSGWKLNTKKTQVLVSRPAKNITQRMLGMTIHVKANVPRIKKRRLRARVHRVCVDYEKRKTQKGSLSEAYARARALMYELNYWAEITPSTIDPLITKLQDTVPV